MSFSFFLGGRPLAYSYEDAVRISEEKRRVERGAIAKSDEEKKRRGTLAKSDEDKLLRIYEANRPEIDEANAHLEFFYQAYERAIKSGLNESDVAMTDSNKRKIYVNGSTIRIMCDDAAVRTILASQIEFALKHVGWRADTNARVTSYRSHVDVLFHVPPSRFCS